MPVHITELLSGYAVGSRRSFGFCILIARRRSTNSPVAGSPADSLAFYVDVYIQKERENKHWPLSSYNVALLACVDAAAVLIARRDRYYR